ncbi:Zinc finger protein 768 [Nymphon striatum]|nr:Zinc finger protein 768 [Nymphon striatum]
MTCDHFKKSAVLKMNECLGNVDMLNNVGGNLILAQPKYVWIDLLHIIYGLGDVPSFNQSDQCVPRLTKVIHYGLNKDSRRRANMRIVAKQIYSTQKNVLCHQITPKPKAQSPKPKAQSPKPKAQSPKPKAQSPKPKAQSPKPKAQSPKPKAQSPKPKAQSPKPKAQSPKPKAQSPKPKAQSPKPKAQSPKPKAQSPKPKAQSPKPKAQSPKPKVGQSIHG